MIKSALKSLCNSLGYKIECIRHTPRQLLQADHLRVLTFDDAVCRLMHDSHADLCFMQIGVYDGVTNDPLRKYIVADNWKGILVEPQSVSVAGLRELYRDNPRIQVVHAALGEQKTKRVLYRVNPEGLPKWVGGLASFDRNTVAKHSELCPGLEEHIQEEIVDCLPFEDILNQLPGTSLDLLQIDTEGADGWILSLFPFERVRPKIVHFEIKHLSKNEREEALQRLVSRGYSIAVSGTEDMLAVLNS